MAGIKVSGLKKTFGEARVIDDLSLSVESGEVYAILGRSGSGKSTLLRLLSLLEFPDDGEAWIDTTKYIAAGHSTVNPVSIRRRISLVFQDHNLLPNFTVLDNCTLAPRRSHGVEKAAAEAAAQEILSTLGVDDLAMRYPNSLSGGQAQRVAIARAILTQPEILLLDEVTSALDPESAHTVLTALERVRGLESAAGVAMIVVTHHLRFASRFATTIGVLEAGRIVEELPAGAFVHNAFSATARSFIGRDATK